MERTFSRFCICLTRLLKDLALLSLGVAKPLLVECLTLLLWYFRLAFEILVLLFPELCFCFLLKLHN